MVSIDIKKNWLGSPQVFSTSREKVIGTNWIDLLHQFTEAGAGEVLLNAVDKDGTLSGPDLDLIQIASKAVQVPLIAVGGISSLEDIKSAINVGASGVAAGAFFVYYGPHRAVLITYPKYEELEKLLKTK